MLYRDNLVTMYLTEGIYCQRYLSLKCSQFYVYFKDNSCDEYLKGENLLRLK